jgi:hypothetical protein
MLRFLLALAFFQLPGNQLGTTALNSHVIALKDLKYMGEPFLPTKDLDNFPSVSGASSGLPADTPFVIIRADAVRPTRSRDRPGRAPTR